MTGDDWSFGIEEEYFLADAKTGCAPVEQAADRFHEVAAENVKAASHEVLKGQVEVQSKPGMSLDMAHDALAGMRRELSTIALGVVQSDSKLIYSVRLRSYRHGRQKIVSYQP